MTMEAQISPDEPDSRTSAITRKRTSHRLDDNVNEPTSSTDSSNSQPQKSRKRRRPNGRGPEEKVMKPSQLQITINGHEIDHETEAKQDISNGRPEPAVSTGISWNKGVLPTVRTSFGRSAPTLKKTATGSEPSTSQRRNDEAVTEAHSNAHAAAPEPDSNAPEDAPAQKSSRLARAKKSKVQKRAQAAHNVSTHKPLDSAGVDGKSPSALTTAQIGEITVIIPVPQPKNVKYTIPQYVNKDLYNIFLPRFLAHNNHLLGRIDYETITEATRIYIEKHYSEEVRKHALNVVIKRNSWPDFCKSKLKTAQLKRGARIYRVVNTSMSRIPDIYDAVKMAFQTTKFQLYQQFAFGMTLDNWGIEFETVPQVRVHQLSIPNTAKVPGDPRTNWRSCVSPEIDQCYFCEMKGEHASLADCNCTVKVVANKGIMAPIATASDLLLQGKGEPWSEKKSVADSDEDYDSTFSNSDTSSGSYVLCSIEVDNDEISSEASSSELAETEASMEVAPRAPEAKQGETSAPPLSESEDSYSPRLEEAVLAPPKAIHREEGQATETAVVTKVDHQQRIPEPEAQMNTEAELLLIRTYYPNHPSTAPLCLTCGETGHTTSTCPSLTCPTCNLRGTHFPTACPLNIRCTKCHTRGHLKSSCPSKLTATSSDPSSTCTICTSSAHTETTCHLLWRSFTPSATARKVQHLLINCYTCGSPGHFGPECGLHRGAPASGGHTWSRANCARYLDAAGIPAVADYSVAPKPAGGRGFSIKGSARHNPVMLSDSDEEEGFIRPKIAKTAPKNHIKFSERTLAPPQQQQQQQIRYPPPPLMQSSYRRAGEREFSPPPRYPEFGEERGGKEQYHDFERGYRVPGRPLSPFTANGNGGGRVNGGGGASRGNGGVGRGGARGRGENGRQGQGQGKRAGGGAGGRGRGGGNGNGNARAGRGGGRGGGRGRK